jgi:hypothetical protein
MIASWNLGKPKSEYRAAKLKEGEGKSSSKKGRSTSDNGSSTVTGNWGLYPGSK